MRLTIPTAIPLILIFAVATARAGDDHAQMPGMTMPPPQPQSQPAAPEHEGHAQPGAPMPQSTPPADAAHPASHDSHAQHGTRDMGSMGGMGHMMSGTGGPYSMMRDASGTSWQPESTPMDALHGELGQWSTMLHGFVDLIYDHQGGPRGGDKTFSESMVMAAAQKDVGPGTLTLRTMLSLDPLMGARGYPLLLQTGETANGVDPLIDRQHPHDLFMELAGIYSIAIDDRRSVFVYAGYPGEPALGPPTFMHRFSGMDDPAAPISHHWLDSTHITFGVLTGGVVLGDWKIEGSLFNGREPDQHRWDFDPLRLDSASARLSWNPSPDLALQVSYGFLKSPEQLEPGIDQHRITASASYNVPLANGNWQTTLAWGRNSLEPGPDLAAVLLESAVRWDRNTVFARAESAQKNELFEPPDPLAGQVFRVASFSLGYIYDMPVADHLKLGLGAVGSIYDLPAAIRPAYGSGPASYMLFTRVKLD
jgi:hypothetical protein